MSVMERPTGTADNRERWDVSLLGLLRVSCGSRSADHFQTRQTALLLAYLAAFPRRHSRDEIVDLLWPDADPDSGRARLSQAIWRLRQTLNTLAPGSPDAVEILFADRNTVGIDSACLSTDIARFRRLVQENALEEAVAAYGDSGGFLVGFYDDWVLEEHGRLLSELLSTLDTLAAQYEAAGDWARAQAAAERAVAADPLREESHAALIRILAASGAGAAARRQYGTLVRLLARELDAEPSAPTQALMAQIAQTATAKTATAKIAAQPTRSMTAPAVPLQTAALPLPLTTFHGRELLQREVQGLLAGPTVRLVTLLGTGGIGKTRLALEIARKAAQSAGTKGAEYGGAAFVSLAEVSEPRLIAEAVAAALTPLRDAPPLERILTAFAAGPDTLPFLLVLDNAEHLAEAAGEVAASLLMSVPRLRVLATSQRCLGVGGEQEILLAPLELPSAGRMGEDAPSVRLFLDRAKSVRRSFPTDSETLTDVARICERLEGLPLAIELCAGWAQTLSAHQMLEMLDRRFELLVSRRNDIPARHRTLRAAMEYSYIQLSKPMQDFLVSLSVFRGGWTLGAAAEVCLGGAVPETLAMLAQMRERSLISADEARPGDGMRYRMPENLRAFALEQRTHVQALAHGAAHAAYFARFVRETAARMHGAEDAIWTARFGDETENIRAALDFLMTGGETPAAWEMTAAAAKAWNTHGQAREAQEWTRRALALMPPPGGEAPLRARLLTVRADALRVLSEYPEAAAAAEAGLALWRAHGDLGGITECTDLLGIVAMLSGDFARAQALLGEALPLARQLGDDSVTAQVLNDLGRVAMAQSDWLEAETRLAEGLSLRRRLGDVRLISSSLGNLGLVHRYRGNLAAARVFLEEAVAIQEQHGTVWFSSLDLNLATVERLEGRYAESVRRLAIAYANAQSHGERRVVAWCLKETGHLAAALRDPAFALRLLACAEALRVALGISFKPLGPADIARDRAAAEAALGPADAAAHWAVGESADPDTLLSHAHTALSACTQK